MRMERRWRPCGTLPCMERVMDRIIWNFRVILWERHAMRSKNLSAESRCLSTAMQETSIQVRWYSCCYSFVALGQRKNNNKNIHIIILPVFNWKISLKFINDTNFCMDLTFVQQAKRVHAIMKESVNLMALQWSLQLWRKCMIVSIPALRWRWVQHQLLFLLERRTSTWPWQEWTIVQEEDHWTCVACVWFWIVMQVSDMRKRLYMIWLWGIPSVIPFNHTSLNEIAFQLPTIPKFI